MNSHHVDSTRSTAVSVGPSTHCRATSRSQTQRGAPRARPGRRGVALRSVASAAPAASRSLSSGRR
eukprot:3673850-Pyramimonas_sp.AAC.1